MDELNKFENSLKEKIVSHEFPFDEKNWEKARVMIDESRKKKKRRFFFFWFFAGILGAAGFWMFLNVPDANTELAAKSERKTVQTNNDTAAQTSSTVLSTAIEEKPLHQNSNSEQAVAIRSETQTEIYTGEDQNEKTGTVTEANQKEKATGQNNQAKQKFQGNANEISGITETVVAAKKAEKKKESSKMPVALNVMKTSKSSSGKNKTTREDGSGNSENYSQTKNKKHSAKENITSLKNENALQAGGNLSLTVSGVIPSKNNKDSAVKAENNMNKTALALVKDSVLSKDSVQKVVAATSEIKKDSLVNENDDKRRALRTFRDGLISEPRMTGKGLVLQEASAIYMFSKSDMLLARAFIIVPFKTWAASRLQQ
jgi:hypothetical protein